MIIVWLSRESSGEDRPLIHISEIKLTMTSFGKYVGKYVGSYVGFGVGAATGGFVPMMVGSGVGKAEDLLVGKTDGATAGL